MVQPWFFIHSLTGINGVQLKMDGFSPWFSLGLTQEIYG